MLSCLTAVVLAAINSSALQAVESYTPSRNLLWLLLLEPQYHLWRWASNICFASADSAAADSAAATATNTVAASGHCFGYLLPSSWTAIVRVLSGVPMSKAMSWEQSTAHQTFSALHQ